MSRAKGLGYALLAGLVAALLWGATSPRPAAAAEPSPPRITIAVVPHQLGVRELSRLPQAAVGVLGTGIGLVPPAQSFLDIGQGNRVSESVYESDLPPLHPRPGRGVGPAAWREVLRRAEDAPGSLVPGLLASTLDRAGIRISSSRDAGEPSLIAADREGRIRLARCAPERCDGVVVTAIDAQELRSVAERLEGSDLLIAIQEPPSMGSYTVAAAVVGRGFRGWLSSPATRIEGFVAATDMTATILDRLGLPMPPEMNGGVLESGGEQDPGALIELRERLEEKGGRRGSVIGLSVLTWCVLAALGAALTGGTARRTIVALLGLAIVYLPVVQLLTGPLSPSTGLELLILALGAPLLAAVTLTAARGWGALVLACAVTVGAFVFDLIAGLDLIPLSILGPNVVAGGRFFGVNNEVEAIVGALLPIGIGAFLATLPRTRDGGTAAVASFLFAGLAVGAVLAIGRLGADVGAAIVLPAGAAGASAVAARSRRGVLFVLLAPIAGLAALAAADTLLGGGAHFTSTVLDADGVGEVLEVLKRKLVLAAKSFVRPSNLVMLPIAIALIVAAALHRRAVREWLGERAAVAGFVGAAVATAIGTATNDSAAAVLVFGTACIAAAVAFAWSRPGRAAAGAQGELGRRIAGRG